MIPLVTRTLAGATLVAHVGLGLGLLAGVVVLVRPQARPAWARAAAAWLAPAALDLAWLGAGLATAGSLFFSEVAGYVPCALCWGQRALMYPLVAVLAPGPWRGRPGTRRLAAALAAIGLVLGATHLLVERLPGGERSPLCGAGAPCATRWVWEFGYVSIPLMSATACLAILALLALARPASGKAPGDGGRRALAVAGPVAVAAVALAVIGQPPPAGETQPVEVVGPDLPDLPETGRDPAVGRRFAEIRGRRFDGAPVAIRRDGRPKLIVFLAHWCPHCQREAPILASWTAARGTGVGLDVYAVATGTTPRRPNYPPSAWLRQVGLEVPTLADDAQGRAARAAGLTAYPFVVVLDQDGRVVARVAGALDAEALSVLRDLALGRR